MGVLRKIVRIMPYSHETSFPGCWPCLTTLGILKMDQTRKKLQFSAKWVFCGKLLRIMPHSRETPLLGYLPRLITLEHQRVPKFADSPWKSKYSVLTTPILCHYIWSNCHKIAPQLSTVAKLRFQVVGHARQPWG